jgi:hypothetical protein
MKHPRIWCRVVSCDGAPIYDPPKNGGEWWYDLLFGIITIFIHFLDTNRSPMKKHEMCMDLCWFSFFFFFECKKVQLLMGHVFLLENSMDWHGNALLVAPTCLDPKLKKQRQQIFWTKWLTLWYWLTVCDIEAMAQSSYSGFTHFHSMLDLSSSFSVNVYLKWLT